MSTNDLSEIDVPSRRKWPTWWPYAVLIVALLLIVAIPGAKPIPVDEELLVTPTLSRPAIDPAMAKRLRETLWSFRQEWFGPECLFDSQRVGHGSVPYKPYEMRYALVTPDTIEIHKIGVREVINGVPHADGMRTVMVLVTKFDSEGEGTLDAVSIEWNEDKRLALQRIEAGDCRKGRYEVNDKTIAVYLARQGEPRPTAIPGLIEYNNILARHPAGSPVPTPKSHAMDSILLRARRFSDEQLPLHMQLLPEEFPADSDMRPGMVISPVGTPYIPAYWRGTIKESNGWIVQADFPIPPGWKPPTNAKYPEGVPPGVPFEPTPAQ